jgi:hypothetical protein
MGKGGPPETDLAHELSFIDGFAGCRFPSFGVLRQIHCSEGAFAQYLSDAITPSA